MLGDELLERVLHLRPPRGVVRRVRLRAVDEIDTGALQVRDVRIDEARRIHRIASAVDDEERLVDEVVRKEIAVGVDGFVLQDAR